MDTKKLIQEAHENAVKHGFYECPDCCGDDPLTDKRICARCNGTGQYADIGQRLGLIMSEFGEAINAWRKNDIWKEKYKRFPGMHLPEYYLQEFKKEQDSYNCVRGCYEEDIKDTFEDELTDIFIRLFDLCGYIGVTELNTKDYGLPDTDNIIATLYSICNRGLPNRVIAQNGRWCDGFYGLMVDFCKQQNIDIETHIRLKMEYNKIRPYKHGGKKC